MALRNTRPPLAPSAPRLDVDGVVGIACMLMLPLALLFV